MSDRVWLTAHEACDYLRITRKALECMIRKRHIKAFKLRSRLRFRRRDLDKLITPLP